MPRQKSNKERYNFLIDKEVYDDFSLICDELGLVRSKNIEIHMKEFNEQHKETLKQVKKR